MKKNKGIFAFIVLIICLIFCILIIKFILPKEEKKSCDEFEYEDILLEINTAVNRNFTINKDMSLYVPVVFSMDTDYIFALDDQNDKNYFIIIKNINEENLSQLEGLLVSNNDLESPLEIKENGIYTYIISSSEFSSTIDGIIRSFVYCN